MCQSYIVLCLYRCAQQSLRCASSSERKTASIIRTSALWPRKAPNYCRIATVMLFSNCHLCLSTPTALRWGCLHKRFSLCVGHCFGGFPGDSGSCMASPRSIMECTTKRSIPTWGLGVNGSLWSVLSCTVPAPDSAKTQRACVYTG